MIDLIHYCHALSAVCIVTGNQIKQDLLKKATTVIPLMGVTPFDVI